MSIYARQKHRAIGLPSSSFALVLVWFASSIPRAIKAKVVDTAQRTSVQYMGRQIPIEEWRELQERLDTDMKYGRWIYSWNVPGFRPLFTNPAWMSRYQLGQCFESNENLGFHYSWAPTNGNLLLWDPEVMCTLANGRNIGFMGDSMTQELYYTFVSAMRSEYIDFLMPETETAGAADAAARVIDGSMHFNRTVNESRFTVYCPEGVPDFKTAYFGSRHLEPTDEFKASISNFEPSIIVLNTGPHFVPDLDELFGFIKGTIDYLYENFQDISIVYRSTSIAHAGCTETFNHPPLSKPPPVRETNAMLMEKYHWAEFGERNDIVNEMLAREFPQVLRLDIHHSQILRSDGHPGYTIPHPALSDANFYEAAMRGKFPDGSKATVDCLHICIPGPVNEWVVMLYNALLRASGGVDEAQAKLRARQQELNETAEAVFTDPDLREITGDWQVKLLRERNHPSYFLLWKGKRHYVRDQQELTKWWKLTGKKDPLLVDFWKMYNIPVGRPVPF